MTVEVHENVLSLSDYQDLEDWIASDKCAWYFSPHHLESKLNPKEPDLWHFTHSVFDDRQTPIIHGGMQGDSSNLSQWNSDSEKLHGPVIDFIEKTYSTCQMIRCKANLYTNQNSKVHYRDHVDQERYDADELLIAILSIGESNGGTVIGDTFYPSQKNQLIVFGNVPHHGVSQTNSQTRICINYNFER